MPKALSTVLELRRRKVFRGIGFYLVGAWTLLQVAEVVVEPAGLPSWTLTALLYVAVVGFPLAVWLAWRYELTEHGLVRTRPATDADSAADYSLKTSDYVIFAAMVAVVAAILWQGLSDIRSAAERTEERQQVAAEAEREAVENSVAVLPFTDLSLDGDQAFLGEGIADTVLHVLSQVKGLTVTARTSSFAFRDRNLTVDKIAAELGVAHILEGSVQRAGEQVRIIARLIDARNGRELWSGNFDRAPGQIFAVQDEIAGEVVTALSVTLLEDDRERLADQYRPDLEAYENYVIGRRELDKGTADSVTRAVTRFQKAIEIDPDYALAHVALANAKRTAGEVTGGSGDFNEIRKEAQRLVERALELDPTLAEAWDTKAMLYAEEKEFEKSAAAIRKALELNPNSADAWAGYWNYLLLIDEKEAALDAIRKAVELDPESSRYQASLARQLFDLGRAEEAIYVLKENVRRHPESPNVYLTLARYLNQTGKPGEAMWYIQSIHRRDPNSIPVLTAVAMQYWQLWDFEQALETFDRLIERAPEDLDARQWAAWLRDDLDEAIRVGELEIAQRPMFWYPKMQQADSLALAGRWEGVIELVTQAYPDLMSDTPTINDWSQWGARRLAGALLKTGRQEQAYRLIDATLEHIQRSRKLQAGGWMAGPEDALLYALLGDDDAALRALDAAISQGWMFYSHAVIRDPALDGLRENPRFMALVDRLQQNLARERQWYAEHANDLLL
jgi:TolB-like protein/Tfp pilus assembly protein PilF